MTRRLLLIFFVGVFALLVIPNASAFLNCTFSSGACTGTSTRLLGVQNDSGGYLTNDHAELATDSNYSASVCCNATTISLSATCGTTLVRLYSDSNSHVEQANESLYTYLACAAPSTGSLDCVYQDNSCPAGYGCVLSMVAQANLGYNGTNAHVGQCGAYTRQLCCRSTGNVCINETGICYPTFQAAINAAVAGQTIIAIDSGIYIESINVTKKLNITSNASTPATILWSRSDYLANIVTGSSPVRFSRLFLNDTNSTDEMFTGTLNGNIFLEDLAISLNASKFSPTFTGSFNRVNMTINNNVASPPSVFAALGNGANTIVIINNSRFLELAGGDLFHQANPANLTIENTFINITAPGGACHTGSASAGNDGYYTIRNVTAYCGTGGFKTPQNFTIINSIINSSSSPPALGIGLGSTDRSGAGIIQNSILNASGNTGTIAINSITGTITITDSIIDNPPHPTILFYQNSNATSVTIINSTIFPWQVSYGGAFAANYTFISYLNVTVVNSTGSSASGASVNLTNNQSVFLWNYTSDSGGAIPTQNVTYAWRNSSFIQNYTNHTISAKIPFVGSVTRLINMSTSQAITLTLTEHAPTTPTLVAPANSTTLTERFPTFNWTTSTDPEDDAITYQWNLTSPVGCAAIPVKNTSAIFYVSIDKLCTDHPYNWSVRACDNNSLCSAWAPYFNFTINSSVGITFTRAAVNFGAMQPSTPSFVSTNNTLTSNPQPFVYNNSGNVALNASVLADAALWSLKPLGTSFFEYADENSSSWVPFTGSYVQVHGNLSIGELRELEINITVPQSESATAKNTTIRALGVSIE